MNLHGNHKPTTLFVNPRPAVEAAAKAVASTPVKPVAPGTALGAALQAFTDQVNKAVATIRAPVPKAAATAAPTPTVRSTGSPPSVPVRTETQRRRDAEAREEARKAAAQADADRVLVRKAGGRVRVLKELDPSLSDAALMALSHIVTKYEANGRQSVPVNGPDLSRALDLPLIAAQAGYAELVHKGHVSSAKNSLGVTRVTPRLAAAAL